MIGLNEAKSRLALRICGKLDHLAACNNLFFIYILFFSYFYLGSLQKLIFQDLYSFLFDISFRFCVYSIVIVGPIDHQLEDL